MNFSWSTTTISDILSHYTGMPTGLANAIEIFICVVVFTGLLLTYLGSVLKKKYDAWVKTSLEMTSRPLPMWRRDQPWLAPTDIRFIEDLKSELFEREKLMNDAHVAASGLLRRREELGVNSSRWRKIRFIDAELTKHTYTASELTYTRISELCAQIERIWGGNAHLEIEDCIEHIEKLKRRRQDVPEDYEKKDKLRSIDEQIISWDRQLRDLREVVRRAQASPHQARYQETRSVRELDMQHEIEEKFMAARTQMETLKVQDALIKQVQTDPSFTEERKEVLIQEIKKAAQGALSTELKPNVFSIYKKKEA